MADRITITVAAGGDDAEARAFADALRDIVEILEQLGKDQLGRLPVWRIVGLTKNSPPTITLECRETSAVGRQFVEGWRDGEKSKTRPFPPRVMRVARRLGRRIGRKQLDTFTAHAPGVAPVTATPAFAENADRIRSEKYYLVPSSVDGKLDVVNVHRGARFSVFDETHHREVRCYFSDTLFGKVKDNIGKRVTVIGAVRFESATDRPVAIRVEQIEAFDEVENTPLLFSEMQPIDLAGGLSSEEYIRRMRDGVGQ